MSDAKVAEAISELNRRLELNPPNRLAVYQQWYREQLEAGIDKDTLHALQAMDVMVQFMANAQGRGHLVLLVHGIRTQGEWQGMIKHQLTRAGTVVEPIKYEFLDAVRFWCPLLTRRSSLKQILWKIRHALRRNPDTKLTIIAHSFGTYAVTKLLKENPDIACERLILCGSIIRRGFRWDMLANCPEECLNDCGSRDIWPVLAESLTLGYGASGTFGFGTPGITERFHDFKHSDYFTPDFVRKFWESWIHDGSYVPSGYEEGRPTTCWFWSILPFFKWGLVLAGGFYLYYRFFR